MACGFASVTASFFNSLLLLSRGSCGCLVGVRRLNVDAAEAALHHLDELVVVDLSVAIGVDTVEQLLNLLVVEREVVRLEAQLQLFGADRAAVVLVEVGEGRTQVVLLQVVVTLQARRDELRVVDEAVLVGVDDVHGVEDFVLVELDLGDLFEPVPEFVEGERTVTVLVHLGEGRTQRLDLVFGDARGDETQRRPLQLHRLHVRLHVREHVHRDRDMVELFVALLLQPWVIVRLLCSETHVSLAF